MKKQLLLLSSLLIAGTVLSIGCMDRKPAPVCPVPTELKASDPGGGGFEGVDILVVVDNSNSMSEEQEILATSFFPLINSLVNPTPDWDFDANPNIRIGITTSDMGVSYNGNVPADADGKFERAKCTDKGDNGNFEIAGTASVEIQEGVIACGEDARQCPPNWDCVDIDDEGVGVCENPNGETTVTCPASPEDKNQRFVDEDWDGDKALSVACLANVGTDGCNYEQQLVAAAAGLENNKGFIRERSLTTILIVSDEEDCSIESKDWQDLSELNSTSANLACGKHLDLLFDVDELKERYDDAKVAAGGNPKGMLFAAIIGVPVGEPDCTGTGSELSKCLDVKPGVNGDGTMEKPDVVPRDVGGQEQFYFEYACQRGEVTKAYPGTRFVKMAQAYQDMSYIYSICEEDWSPAMEAIAELIAENLSGTCYSKRLAWNPADETAGCNVVFDYRYSKKDNPSAPDCPSGGDYKWESDSGQLTESPDGDYWIRSCTVKKLPAPINCEAMTAELKADYADTHKFGWYYCENPGEDNSEACKDNLDNDRDGKTDKDDEDCEPCYNNGNCSKDCPYRVSLTPAALAEVSGNAYDANVVCLQQYRFEDPNCKESTRNACTDGEDNDGNGPYDCWSFAKDNSAGEEPRKADPDCCPMQVDKNGNCQFLNPRSQPVNAGNAAWVDNCETDPTAKGMPDSCCEASLALLCQLPAEFKAECEARGM